LATFQVVLLDLDGTVYHEESPLPGALELIRSLQAQGRRFACLSNSASSPARVAERLQRMGAPVPPEAIYTAAAASCDYVVEHLPGRPRVFNLATPSVYEMLGDRVAWVEHRAGPCDVVIAGGPSNLHASEERQRTALYLLRAGARLVGLCADRVFPSTRGLEFGAGALSAMLAYAANVTPFFCGKPDRIFFLELCRRLQVRPAECVLVGDNLESDVRGAKAVGMGSVLVLSGVTRAEDLAHVAEEARPDCVIPSLLDLLPDATTRHA
jgi:4-nitrophenyl phosphatase